MGRSGSVLGSRGQVFFFGGGGGGGGVLGLGSGFGSQGEWGEETSLPIYWIGGMTSLPESTVFS